MQAPQVLQVCMLRPDSVLRRLEHSAWMLRPVYACCAQNLSRVALDILYASLRSLNQSCPMRSYQVVRRWAALSIGKRHAAGVSGDADCYTWGANTAGQLGVAPGEPKDVPMKMDILRGWDVRAISCGYVHRAAGCSGSHHISSTPTGCFLQES